MGSPTYPTPAQLRALDAASQVVARSHKPTKVGTLCSVELVDVKLQTAIVLALL